VDTKLAEDIDGRVGLWSKADSKVLFERFEAKYQL
jgi:hypothetical protein